MLSKTRRFFANFRDKAHSEGPMAYQWIVNKPCFHRSLIGLSVDCACDCRKTDSVLYAQKYVHPDRYTSAHVVTLNVLGK